MRAGFQAKQWANKRQVAIQRAKQLRQQRKNGLLKTGQMALGAPNNVSNSMQSAGGYGFGQQSRQDFFTNNNSQDINMGPQMNQSSGPFIHPSVYSAQQQRGSSMNDQIVAARQSLRLLKSKMSSKNTTTSNRFKPNFQSNNSYTSSSVSRLNSNNIDPLLYSDNRSYNNNMRDASPVTTASDSLDQYCGTSTTTTTTNSSSKKSVINSRLPRHPTSSSYRNQQQQQQLQSNVKRKDSYYSQNNNISNQEQQDEQQQQYSYRQPNYDRKNSYQKRPTPNRPQKNSYYDERKGYNQDEQNDEEYQRSKKTPNSYSGYNRMEQQSKKKQNQYKPSYGKPKRALQQQQSYQPPPAPPASYPQFQDQYGQQPTNLKACPDCGRKFNQNAYLKHIKICQKVFQQKRKKFDASKQRQLQDEDNAGGFSSKMNKKYGRKPTQKFGTDKKKLQNQPIKPQSKMSKWKAQSLQFRQAMQACRGGKESSSSSGMDFGPGAYEIPDGRTECPYCNRKFNDQAAQRHIPICQQKHKQSLITGKSSINKSNNLSKYGKKKY